ncbi:MAG: DUF4347 domain-containing protein, partial [Methylococcaceae bacterium]
MCLKTAEWRRQGNGRGCPVIRSRGIMPAFTPGGADFGYSSITSVYCTNFFQDKHMGIFERLVGKQQQLESAKVKPARPVSQAYAFALEPRLLFDGAEAATLADAALADAPHAAHEADAAGPSMDALLQALANTPPPVAPLPVAATPEPVIAVSDAVGGDSAAAPMDAGRDAEPAPIAPPDSTDNAEHNVAADGTTTTVPLPVELRPLDAAANGGKKEVVFIESNVADYQTLVDGVRPGVEVLLLDGQQDGLAQIAAWAQSHSGYDAMHIISHGAEGELLLGSAVIDDAALVGRSADLTAIGRALKADGDLLLYGCDVAKGAVGLEFIRDIAADAGVDVAASDDTTGLAREDGNWDLEVSTGTIDVSSLSFLAYQHVLGDTTFDFSTGTVGSNTGGTGDVTQTAGSYTVTVSVPIVSGGAVDHDVQARAGATYVNDWDGATESVTISFGTQVVFKTVDFATSNSSSIGLTITAVGTSDTGTKSITGAASTFTANWSGVTGVTITKTGGGVIPIMIDNIVIGDYVVTDSTSTVTASSTLTEPSTIATTATGTSNDVNLLDFKITDAGTSDGVATTVSSLTVDVSGTSTDAERGLMTFLLNGPDATDVVGTYDSATDKITFSGLSISVANAGNETYTLSAYFNDSTSTNDITDGHAVILSVDGDTNFTTGSGSSTMQASQSAVTNGSGAAIDVAATKLVFSQAPSGTITSGVAFGTQPIVQAVDARGNVDTGYTGTVTLTNDSSGALNDGDSTVDKVAISGVADFTSSNVKYLAAFDVDANFIITAAVSGLTSATSGSIDPDVVATQLVFTTQPAPTSIQSGSSTSFTAVPVVKAEDANNVVDTGYTTNIVLSVSKTDGNAITASEGTVNSLAVTSGDQDGGTATGITLSSASTGATYADGVATFTGLSLQFTNTDASESIALHATSGSLTAATSSTITSSTNQSPNAGGAVTVTAAATGNAVSIQEDATPGTTANIRLTPPTQTDPDAGDTVTQVRIISVTGGTLTQSGGTLITTGASGTLLSLTSGSVDLVFTPTANRETNATFSYVMVDSAGANSTASTATVSITAVNDVPALTAGSLSFTAVDEDSANATAVSLGLSAVTYGPGGGTDESGQTLTYTITAIPSFITLWKSDGTTQVNANDTVTASELQGLKYKTVADANGTGNLTFTVADNGGT